MEDILRIVFAIAVLGHGMAHLVATLNLGRQLAGKPKEGTPEVRTPILRDASATVSGALGLVFWLPATIGFIVAAPAVADLVLAGMPWSAILVASALVSTVGVALFGGIWPGGEPRLRVLHVFLALSMNAITLVTQLVMGWPATN